MSGISRDEWLTALGVEARQGDPDALSITEIGAMLGLKASATKVHVRRLLAEGTLKPALKRMTDTAGRSLLVPAYVLVKVRRGAK